MQISSKQGIQIIVSVFVLTFIVGMFGSQSMMSLLGSLGYVLSFCAIYFMPSIVAYLNKAKSFSAIFVLNLFLGWTLIGWIIALVWALKNEKTP